MATTSGLKYVAITTLCCVAALDKGVGAVFYQGCLTRLILQKVVNRCRCLPFDVTAKELGTEDYKACSWDRLICIYGTIGKVQEDNSYLISLNQCYQRCDYVQYSTEVEYIKHHRELKSLATAHSRVAVHFSVTTCLKYRREVLYTWDQMLANLGGIFGLCLGGSIISVLELLWFLVHLLFSILAVLRNKNIAPKEEKIFTVTEKHITKKIPKKPIGFLRYEYVN
ncbi:hypothetical protein K1T71_004243 [Dendrolimus kikuchii]|uniref:Uncharacterized protein n=1 Tax=Dendrolimus kikuchii TaxID=765133 RepID=A0ACC1D7W0_9NEOP|nr:hypothetical protein K1T71_004243 [Dendrolimus kikuchii]